MVRAIGIWLYKYHMLTEKLINLNIDTAEFERLWTPAVRQTADILSRYGFDFRVVGGAVRDFLQGQAPRDIDFATDADPSQLIYVFNQEHVQHDDKGIAHGTVKSVIGDEKVDVTSIAYKVEQKDGNTRVIQHRDWEQDAQNRDFTVNSMSVDPQGTLYDYTGGLDDLSRHVIRMLPNTPTKIKDDPHLMLRWFKAIAAWEDSKWLRKDYDAVRSNLSLLGSIKGDEKTDREIASIIRGQQGHRVLEMMCRMGAGRYLGIDCNLD